MIGVIDYAAGNLRSVENALLRLNVSYRLVRTPIEMQSCDALLLPGVGDAHWAMAHLVESHLDEALLSATCPVLGVCLGMQLMCSYSEENDTPCLNVFPQHVVRMQPSPEGACDQKIKVPHIGWNTLSHLKGPLFEGIREGDYVYFVHSYAALTSPETVASFTHGDTYSAALAKGRFFGCQFHPEKSGSVGERILLNFIRLCQY